MDEPPVVQMPRMMVLNYVTGQTTPTRTRRIAAASLFTVAILTLLGAATFLLVSTYRSYHYATVYARYRYSWSSSWPLPPPPPLSIPEEIFEGLKMFAGLPETLWGTILLGLGISYLISSAGVRRGSRRAAIFAAWIFTPVLLPLVFISAALIGTATVNLVGLYDMHERWLILLVIPGLLFVVLTLLALDVHAMLRWAVRNPSGEMGKRAFLPGKG